MRARVCSGFAASWALLAALTAIAQPAANPAEAAAIEGIAQGADPSAVVAAYAKGMASHYNPAKLNQAYVRRMVDLGLPEMAYHQAQMLTNVQPQNGIAWGVVAYVDARRGLMPEAISAIALAAQSAPDDKFVARTAGELCAWYDLQADKPQLGDNVKNKIAKVRAIGDLQPAFIDAYNAACKAYRTEPQPNNRVWSR